jgi:O-antigen/teichoic acid export membrane protein
VTRNGLIYLSSNAAVSAALLLLLPLLLHTLPPATYGAYVRIELLLGLFSLLSSAGLGAAVQRYLVNQPDPAIRTRVVSSAVRLLSRRALLPALLLSGPATLLPGSLLNLTTAHLPLPLVLLVAAAAVGESLLTLLQSVLRAEQRAGRFALLSLSRALLLILATLLGLQLFDGLTGALVGRAVAAVLPLAAGLLLLGRQLSAAPDAQISADLRGYGRPLLPANLLQMLLFNADRWLLALTAPLESLAIYAFAARIAALPDLLLTRPLLLDWGPRRLQLAARPDSAVRLGNAVLPALLLIGSGNLAVLALTPTAYAWFAPPAYRHAAAIVPLLLGANLLFNLGSLLNIGPFVRDRTARLIPLSAAALLIAVTLLVLLQPLGLPAVAAAMLIAAAVSCTLLAITSQRLVAIRLPLRRLLTAAALLLLGAAVLATFNNPLLRLSVAAVTSLAAARLTLGPFSLRCWEKG